MSELLGWTDPRPSPALPATLPLAAQPSLRLCAAQAVLTKDHMIYDLWFGADSDHTLWEGTLSLPQRHCPFTATSHFTQFQGGRRGSFRGAVASRQESGIARTTLLQRAATVPASAAPAESCSLPMSPSAKGDTGPSQRM